MIILYYRVAEVTVEAQEWLENKEDLVPLDHEVHEDKLASQEQL